MLSCPEDKDIEQSSHKHFLGMFKKFELMKGFEKIESQAGGPTPATTRRPNIHLRGMSKCT